MSTYSLSSSSPSVPPEIWLQIFHTSTFIPGEWNISATASHPGIFSSADELQNQALKAVLPLRRAIVQVSRLWWQIGTEVLYASFHETPTYYHLQTQSIDHFKRSLLSRPALGCLIKRLVLRWPRKGSPSEIDHILQLCPNTRILSFYSADPARHVLWEPRILFNHIRIFDADVLYLSQKCIVHMLSSLPNLEMLHLCGLGRGDEESRYHGTLRLPLVYFLSLRFVGAQAIEYWTPLLSTADIPCLTSLSTNHNGIVPLSLSIDAWQRITFFTFPLGSYSVFEPGIFRSLTRLQLDLLTRIPIRQLSGLPFHQMSHLTMIYRSIQYGCVSQWKQTLEVFLGLEMPRLRVVELHWGDDGIHSSLYSASGQDEYLEAFFDYLESSAHKFEQVGVQFREVYTRNIYRVPIPIKDVIKSAREKMAIRLALPFSAEVGCLPWLSLE